MKAISLWQPWATLIAIKAKQIETRSWHPGEGMIGKRIAIHAAKRWTQEEADTCSFDPFCKVLREHYGFHPDDPHCSFRDNLPFGMVIATARLEVCVPTEMTRLTPRDWLPVGYQVVKNEHERICRVDISPQESEFGNYAANRWAWLLSDIHALANPFPFKGAQGFFSVPL